MLHRFVPLDVPAWAARFLDHWRPDAAGFVESELWPNLLAACRARGIPVMLINARLSDRSLTRWQRAPGLARQLLGSFAQVQPRSETDAARLRPLGCCKLSEAGDLKLAASPLPADDAELQRLRDMLQADDRSGSPPARIEGEEALVLAAHQALAADHPGLLTIIAPRHPERGATIAGAGFRSRGDPPPNEGAWIVDTLGEMGLWYRLAPITLCRPQPAAARWRTEPTGTGAPRLCDRRGSAHRQFRRPRRDVAFGWCADGRARCSGIGAVGRFAAAGSVTTAGDG